MAQKERIAIEGLIYERQGWNPKFGFMSEKEAKGALPSWNNALWGKRKDKTMGRFSAEQNEAMAFINKQPMWGLVNWDFVEYTEEYTKKHPWVNYESKADWQAAMNAKKKR